MKPVFHCNHRTGDVWHTCPGCGAQLTIVFPITTLAWLAQLEKFAAEHCNCRRP